MAPSIFVPRPAATSSWRSRRTAGTPPTAAPTITIRCCRRATRSLPSGCGCSTGRRSTRSCTWARTAPSNGCPARRSCCPEAVLGPLPVIYPFIVSNPGEAAQAKRRIAAVTIGHLQPPLAGAELTGEARELERLVDEYAQADGLDRRRRERLARLIVETAQRSGLAREAGVATDVAPDAALRKIDAWLCDLKDLAIKNGLHVYGRSSPSPLDGPSPSPLDGPSPSPPSG